MTTERQILRRDSFFSAFPSRHIHTRTDSSPANKVHRLIKYVFRHDIVGFCSAFVATPPRSSNTFPARGFRYASAISHTFLTALASFSASSFHHTNPKNSNQNSPSKWQPCVRRETLRCTSQLRKTGVFHPSYSVHSFHVHFTLPHSTMAFLTSSSYHILHSDSHVTVARISSMNDHILNQLNRQDTARVMSRLTRMVAKHERDGDEIKELISYQGPRTTAKTGEINKEVCAPPFLPLSFGP